MTRECPGGTRHRRTIDTMKIVLLGLTLLLSPYVALTQTAIRYIHDEHLKQYATERVDGTDQDFVMAGTSFGPTTTGTDDVVPHFVYFSYDQMLLSNLYDDADIIEERAVDVEHYVDNGTFVMVCMARYNDPTKDRDMIKVLELDANGTIIQDLIFEVTSGAYENLYPLNSMMIGDMLYICGFATKDGTELPNEPGYGPYDYKAAFVLKHDMTNTVPDVCSLYNYTYSYIGGTPTGFPNKDYDIAMRLKVVPGGSNIFVTGSVNGAFGSLGAPLYLSSTMNMTINPTTLAVVTDNPFLGSSGEYGVDIIQNTNCCNGGYYIVGNEFDQNAATSGFDTNPGFFWVTWVDNSFQAPLTTLSPLYTRTPRYLFNEFDYAWAMQALPPTDIGNGYQMIVAGMQDNHASCTYSDRPSESNYNPFLTEMFFNYVTGANSASIVASHKYFKTYMTMGGTGQSFNTDSYHLLGEGLSNPAWRPTFATRDPNDNNSHIIMSAPHKYGPEDGYYLNLKYLHTDEDGDIDINCGVVDCSPGNLPIIEVVEHDFPNILSNRSVTNCPITVSSGNSSLYIFSAIDSPDCINGNGYRPSQVSNVPAPRHVKNITLYPNPAATYVSAALPRDLNEDTHVVIDLLDMQGKKIKKLYKGNVKGLKAKEMNLPDVVPGIYFAQISISGKPSTMQKIEIK